MRGFPALFEEALPAYRTALARHGDEETARFALLARLMQCVEDTTTLHRAGPAGLARIRDDGQQLEKTIAGGGDFRACLEQLDGEYIRQNLTMGGVAVFATGVWKRDNAGFERSRLNMEIPLLQNSQENLKDLIDSRK